MTLGSSPSPADIVAELGESFPYTFPDAKTRWLADVGASSPITFPTSFANKTSVKVVATAGQASGGSPHTFTGVDFGLAFTGRVLIACVGLESSGEVQLDQTSVTIGGVSAPGGDAGQALNGGPAIGAGVWAASVPSGASGNVVVNWAGGSAQSAALVLLSVASISATAHDSNPALGLGTAAGTSVGSTLNIPANGVLVAAVAHQNTNNTVMSGVTERTNVSFGGSLLTVGFNNRLGVQTGRSVSGSWSGSTARGFHARSYAQ